MEGAAEPGPRSPGSSVRRDSDTHSRSPPLGPARPWQHRCFPRLGFSGNHSQPLPLTAGRGVRLHRLPSVSQAGPAEQPGPLPLTPAARFTHATSRAPAAASASPALRWRCVYIFGFWVMTFRFLNLAIPVLCDANPENSTSRALSRAARPSGGRTQGDIAESLASVSGCWRFAPQDAHPLCFPRQSLWVPEAFSPDAFAGRALSVRELRLAFFGLVS